MVKIEKIIYWLSDKLSWVAAVGLIGMMGLTVADVIGRRLFDKPITGSFDAVSLIGLLIVATAMALTQVKRGHVSVDFLVQKLNFKPRTILLGITYLVGAFLFGLIAWQGLKYGNALLARGEVSQTVKIPLAPFAYVISFSCLMLCLVLIVDFLKSLTEVIKKWN